MDLTLESGAPGTHRVCAAGKLFDLCFFLLDHALTLPHLRREEVSQTNEEQKWL